MTLRIQPTKFRIQNSVYVSRLTYHVGGLLLALASFLLYLRTLAPDVVDADGGEFQFAAWNFSFAHPTGYPLYLILGGLFQHLVPMGNPAYRLNVFTALTAALAVAAFYLAAHEFTHHRSAALIAAASFAVTRAFWFDASAAETYDLNAFFIALLIFIALRWQAQPGAKTFAAFCFVYGLALTHHRTIVLWLPAFALFFLISRRFRISDFRSRITYHASFDSASFDFATLRSGRITHHVLRFTFFFLLPLSLYLYIPLRAPAAPYAALALAPGRDIVLYDNSFGGFVNYFLGRVFQSEIGWDAVSVARLAAFPQMLLDQFGAIGVALGLVGLGALMWRKEWARLALLLCGFAATILFASAYHIGDIFHYYIPAYLVWAVWIGAAVAWIFNGTRNTQYVLRAACSVFLVGFVIAQFTANLPFADRSGETWERAEWTRILAAPIPPSAILISNDRDEMMPLWYIQFVEQTRRDVLGLFPLITPAPQHANIARLTDSVLDAGRPVYFVKAMPGMEIKYRLAPADPLVRVVGRAADAAPQFASDALIAERVRVIGYDATRAANELRVAIYWQPRVQLDADYTTFAHLLDARGNKVAQGSDHQVGGVFYPTSLWQTGETLRDEQVIALPADTASGAYRLLVGMYHQPDGALLGEPAEIGTIKIP